MSGAEANTLWAGGLADELARCGVREVVLAPGSRSTPLVTAFARDGRFRMRVHLDERSAAFFALGVGKASRWPAVLVTTSGTAAANAFPAVVEAASSETPLLVLTADRPPRLRGADANQTIDQVRLFGPYPRAFFELGVPTLEPADLRWLRTVACRAAAAAAGPPGGPVHINCAFDKPLEPVEGAGERMAAEHPLAAHGRPDGEPFVRVRWASPAPPADELEELAEALRAAERGVVVAGPSADPARVGPAASRLAAAAGFPLLADPLSGARFGPASGALRVAGYDLVLGDEGVRERLAPSLVVRVGQSPTSAALQGWLRHHNGVRHVLVDAGARWLDHEALVTEAYRWEPAAALEALAGALDAPPPASSWLAAWSAASEAARCAAADSGDDDHEGRVLGAVTRAAAAGSALLVSGSMPVRDLDAYGAPREEPLMALGNRGASGIDGVVSTACGVAAAWDGPTVCVLGDLALFHDQNGLLWTREADVEVVFVLIDNDGGGIFHMLPVRGHEPHFTPYFATPHGLDFRHSAELFGLPLQDVETSAVGEAVASAMGAGGSRVLRVRTDRERNRLAHERVREAAREAVRAALGL